MKERELLDAALTALRSDGNVLIPSDTAGRVLEVLLIFDRHWCAAESLGISHPDGEGWVPGDSGLAGPGLSLSRYRSQCPVTHAFGDTHFIVITGTEYRHSWQLPAMAVGLIG